MNDVLLQLNNVSKTYSKGDSQLEVLKNIDLDIYEGDAVCILGASGAGKSTLLHILGTLDRPSSGELMLKGEDLNEKNDGELAIIRNREMGFVFQFHHLLAEFSAVENVMLPARISGLSLSQSRSRAEELLDSLGLKSRQNHFPSEMSGGEQQRVAVARALVQRPKVLFADEPTGNLDTENSRQIQELFFSFKMRFGLTMVVVTHDPNFADRFPRRLLLRDGHWN